MPESIAQDVDHFITRWQASGAAERANYQLFLTELCELLGVERPLPKTPHEQENAYVFEKVVPSPHATTNFIDLYKRGCFVLEAKQGSDPHKGYDRPDDGQAPFSEAALRRMQQRKKGTAVRSALATFA
ncbi:MAG: hypothetical protein KJ069_13040 [Anaerolineae bacterium]|nr:hypothetical protein [Anaerolineae bacterium]